jgi:hypothetical protein
MNFAAQTALKVAGSILAAFGVQAIGYLVSEDAGDIGVLISIAIVAYASWIVGRALGRRLALLAILGGGAIGIGYWFVNWHFLRLLRIDVLHQFNENNIAWIAGLYALLMWPTILLCAAAAALSAWRNVSPRTNPASTEK